MSKEEQIKAAAGTDNLVLVEFFATWCTHCKHMKPVVHAFKEEMKGVVDVIEVDIDKNESLASYNNIDGTPTFILFRRGEALWRQSGEMPLERLLKAVRNVNPL